MDSPIDILQIAIQFKHIQFLKEIYYGRLKQKAIIIQTISSH
ncbi:hypothetical protein AKUH3B111A_13440 [Apilactobacillus kunkeei]|nr:hypothetical protein AKUH1B302M_13120 [Apilactobacillus kunkeei]CAI2653670.1 hypothetical protein AKUH4B402J_12850 [Apilactobacillus kunkeei]CAI2655576.1 hypothetical protein AKUH3B103M_13470 [Apilactobacillus kunkeei]CAI2656886.1 hypothetical protein AKUH4B204J_13590 [Apilactobacillus kunkeei]CAI2656966.1 hypothetical protein AKUH3B102A_13710 [Apilactobacillus kunkeei]